MPASRARPRRRALTGRSAGHRGVRRLPRRATRTRSPRKAPADVPRSAPARRHPPALPRRRRSTDVGAPEPPAQVLVSAPHRDLTGAGSVRSRSADRGLRPGAVADRSEAPLRSHEVLDWRRCRPGSHLRVRVRGWRQLGTRLSTPVRGGLRGLLDRHAEGLVLFEITDDPARVGAKRRDDRIDRQRPHVLDAAPGVAARGELALARSRCPRSRDSCRRISVEGATSRASEADPMRSRGSPDSRRLVPQSPGRPPRRRPPGGASPRHRRERSWSRPRPSPSCLRPPSAGAPARPTRGPRPRPKTHAWQSLRVTSACLRWTRLSGPRRRSAPSSFPQTTNPRRWPRRRSAPTPLSSSRSSTPRPRRTPERPLAVVEDSCYRFIWIVSAISSSETVIVLAFAW